MSCHFSAPNLAADDLIHLLGFGVDFRTVSKQSGQKLGSLCLFFLLGILPLLSNHYTVDVSTVVKMSLLPCSLFSRWPRVLVWSHASVLCARASHIYLGSELS